MHFFCEIDAACVARPIGPCHTSRCMLLHICENMICEGGLWWNFLGHLVDSCVSPVMFVRYRGDSNEFWLES